MIYMDGEWIGRRWIYNWYNGNIMCGRYSLAIDYDAISDRFSFRGGVQTPLLIRPRFNIAPTQDVLTVVNVDKGNEPRMMKWGLIPFWANDPSIGNRMINARAETLMEKSAFKNAFQRRRCLVLADGFYEWKRDNKYKVPMRIILKTGEPFGFAGLWETWKSSKGEVVHSCSIITTIPNAILEPIHNRMPVILSRESECSWLTSDTDSSYLRELLLPYPADAMEVYQVSALVNASNNDTPEVTFRVMEETDRA